MRLDATLHQETMHYTVYHAELCEVLRHVVWVDDQTHQWCEYVWPFQIVNDELLTETKQAREIQILPDIRLIIINPIADQENAPAVVDAIAA